MIKTVWQNVLVFLKKNWLVCAGSFGFIILLMMFLPVFRSSWLYFPDSLRTRIALKKLAAANEAALYCREDCSAKRLLYKNIISSGLSQEKEELLPDLEAVILDSKTLPEIRSLMIAIWQDNGFEPSEKMMEYYNNSSNLFSLRAQLARAWSQISSASFVGEIIGNFKTAQSDQEKENLLSLLTGRSDQIVTNLIWNIILGDYSDNLKSKAWFLLSNIDNKQTAYQAIDLDNLRAVLESGDYPHRLKDSAILVLNDYYLYYPELSEALLLDVTNRAKYFDAYQRSFAIDILNRHRTIKLPNLEISQADTDTYFRN